MTLHEKLVACEKYIKENGYPDASIVKGKDGSEMIVFKIENVTAKYPNEKPNVSVAFANSTMNSGEINFDVMQVLCFISSGVPSERLMDIQKFCADFNKAMQVGHFGVDFKHDSVYFKCAQVMDKNSKPDYLLQLFDSVLTMILFYFGYVYEILIELSYGIIGYGGTSHRLRERRRVINEAMAELRGVSPVLDPDESDDKNRVIEELLARLKAENPNILEEAHIDMASIRGGSDRKLKRQSSAEETAAKIMDLANALKNEKPDNEADGANEKLIEVSERSTVSDNDSSSMKNQMPSITMFTQREKRQPEPPLDMEELRRALLIEQEERARLQQGRDAGEGQAEEELLKISDASNAKSDAADAAADKKDGADNGGGKSPDSLLQRLRKWTQG